MNEDFEFNFVGLDAKTQDDVAELNSKLVKTTRTVDELRAEDDLEPLPDGKGEIILDPTWLQNAQSIDAQGEGGEGEGGEGEAPDFTQMFGEEEENETGQGQEKTEEPKQQPEAAQKSLRKSNGRKYLVDLEL